MAEIKLKPLTAGWLLVVIYAGSIGAFILPQTRPWAEKLFWIVLALTFIILLCYHKKWNKEFMFSAFLIAICGFLISVLAVKTGYLFGYFQYGPALGYSFLDTPLMMMPIWFTSIYICRQVAEMIGKDSFLVSVVAALLLVLTDYFMEPFAIKHKLWQWNSGTVTMHNYTGLFICGIIIQYLFIKAIKYPTNKLALPIYLIQLGFYILLYFTGI